MPGRAAVRAGTQMTVGEGEDAALGCDNEVASEHQAESGPCDGAFDAGDHRHPEVVDVADDDMDPLKNGIEPGPGFVVVGDLFEFALKAFYVAAGHKVISGPGQDNTADIFADLQRAGDFNQRCHHVVIDGVQAVRSIDGDGGDCVFDVDADRVVRRYDGMI